MVARLLNVVSIETHSIGRTMGKEIMVKSEALPPAFATIAANTVVEDASAKPPVIIVMIKVNGDLMSICSKKTKRGVIQICSKKERDILKMSFDKRIISCLEFNLRKRDVPCSSSLMKMWESPFIALKNIMIQKITDCILVEIGTLPEDRLMASVDMTAKDIDIFSA